MQSQWVVIDSAKWNAIQGQGWFLGDYQTGDLYIITGHMLYHATVQETLPYRGETKVYFDLRADFTPVEVEGHWTLLPGPLLVGTYYENDVIPKCYHGVLGEVEGTGLLFCGEREEERVMGVSELEMFQRIDHLLWVYGENK